MDGRRLRLWLSGMVVCGTFGCHKQQTLPGGANLPRPGQPLVEKKSFLPFSSKAPPAPTSPSSSAKAVAPELALFSKPADGKKEWSADTIAAFADLRAQMAVGPETPQTNREGLTDSARQAYQAALARDPKHKGSLVGLAKLYVSTNALDKADEMFRQCLQHHPQEHTVAYEAAMAHARAKDFTGAVTWCQAALKIDPENRVYRKTLGFCLSHAGRWEEGFAALCQVMPEAQARYDMARALAHLNQHEMSKQQLALAIQADANFAPAREYLAELQSPTQAVPRTVESAAPPVQAVEYRLPSVQP